MKPIMLVSLLLSLGIVGTNVNTTETTAGLNCGYFVFQAGRRAARAQSIQELDFGILDFGW